MSSLLNVAQLNPMHASSQDRLDTIAFHMKDFDIVTLIGTKYKHQPYLQESLSRRRAGDSTMLDAGHGKGRYTNSHAGIGFLINNRTLKESNLVEKGAITGEARGRAAYVRFKVRGGDFAFLGAYFPPKPSVKSEHSKYLKTCELVANYLAEVIGKLPNGCTPLISVDLNDGIGRVKRGSKYVYNDTSVINEYASRMEKFEDGAGAMFRRVCESKGLVVHTANHDDRNTWFSGDGKASSLIDYIAGPALLPIRKAGQLSRMGSILQPVDVNREVDHKPTFICFYTGTDKSKVTPPPKQEWNQNLMMEELKTGKLRPQFVQAVETRLQTLHEDHPTLLSNTPQMILPKP